MSSCVPGIRPITVDKRYSVVQFELKKDHISLEKYVQEIYVKLDSST